MRHIEIARFVLALGLAGLCGAAFPSPAIADIAAELKKANKALQARDYDTAFREFGRAARERNNPLAQFSLGLFYQLGWGRSADPVKACEWFEKAAMGQIPTAQHAVADCFERGVHRPADPAQAAVWYQKAANMGHVTSYCHLAKLYMAGKGVPKDPKKGLGLCQQAAQRGSVPAQRMLGALLLGGDESIRDPKAALSWFGAAAQRHDAAAQYHVGVMLRDGLGGAKDTVSARSWLEAAAAQGFRRAYLPTAKSYFEAFSGAAPGGARDALLAKAYLWMTATTKRSKDAAEARDATRMLAKLRKIMPPQWAPDLDKKVAQHLAKFSSKK